MTHALRIIASVAFLARPAVGAAQQAPAKPLDGYAYTVTVTTDPPSTHIGATGGPDQQKWVAHAQITGARGRMDIVEGGLSTLFSKGDYLLVDSTETAIVRPADQTFVLMANESRAMVGMLSDPNINARLSDEKVFFDSIASGETISGFPTTHYRLRLGFNLEAQGPFAGGRIGSEAVTDYWVAVIPGMPANTWLRANATSGMPAMMQSLVRKVDSATARLGNAVVLRSSGTNTLMLGPGYQIETRTALDVSDIRRVAVNQSLLILPTGYKLVSLTDLPADSLGDGAKWRGLPPGR